MVRSGVDESAAGAILPSPLQTVNRHRTIVTWPTSEGRVSIFVPRFRGVIEYCFFFIVLIFSTPLSGDDDRFGETYRVIWKPEFFCYWFFSLAFLQDTFLASLLVSRFVDPSSKFRRFTTVDGTFLFFPRRFFLRSAALYSRMFIWRICIMYACCGTPLGSAL